MLTHAAYPHMRHKKAHLGICGSIAAYKGVDLLRALLASGMSAGTTLTESAQQFLTPLTFQALGADPVHSRFFGNEATPFAHLEPGQKSDIMVIAPATAGMIAKIATGLSDDLLSCQVLAHSGPLVIAPSMNHRMWSATATRENWDRLKSRGNTCIEPETGPMACGESGKGRFPCVGTIMAHVGKALADQDLHGKDVLITLGPTREYLDPVRFLSNPSSGLMGQALALAAWMRGARVHVVQGPVESTLPSDIVTTRVQSAQEMYDACIGLWETMDIGCLVDAVSDFRPQSPAESKLKKTELKDDHLSIPFLPNPDILADLGKRKKGRQILVGFAAETDSVISNAQSKLSAKNLDLIVANRVGPADSGFEATTNRVHLLDANGNSEEWDLLPKTEIAWCLWDRISEL
ncbi:MAG: bifunctional phosphopantothenoylcysteine decarboxylase/phosphopantothenate--cysteine ligase CoaBC [Desulfovibrionales bacterium]